MNHYTMDDPGRLGPGSDTKESIMTRWIRHLGGASDRNHEVPRGLIVLIVCAALLVVGISFFAVLPDTFELASFRVPLISGLVGLTLAAIGNLTIGLIQHQTSREAARTLHTPLDRLDSAVDKMEQIHFFHERGVEGIFSNRNEAMPHFLDEIEREERWIGIVGTSLLGAIDPSARSEEKQKLTELFTKKLRENVRIDALLMHPAYGEFRERVENRSRAAVAKDIQSTLANMIRPSVEGSENQCPGDAVASVFDIDNVRLYPGVITAFAIFTKRAMLLNTSSLTGPVYDNVAIIIHDTEDANSIYKKFRASHFDEPWKSEKTIALTPELLKELIGINFGEDRFSFREGEWRTKIVAERSSAPPAPGSGSKKGRQEVPANNPEHVVTQ